MNKARLLGTDVGKQIVVDVMRKLLHPIFRVLKSGQRFNPNKRGLKSA